MRDIKGYEGLYAITRDGRVWAYPRKRSSKFGKWLKLNKHTNTKGRIKPRSWLSIGLYKNKKRISFQVHVLVGLTYIPNPENKPQINHIDGDSLNNWDWNLEWATDIENMQHAQKFGLLTQFTDKQIKGRSKAGKLTGAINGMKSRRMFSMGEVDCIRKIHEIGKKSCRAIAKVYGCSNNTISNMCNYKSYLQEI
jgi:hypothetical protein